MYMGGRVRKRPTCLIWLPAFEYVPPAFVSFTLMFLVLLTILKVIYHLCVHQGKFVKARLIGNSCDLRGHHLS
jgi:fatty acid desaturase